MRPFEARRAGVLLHPTSLPGPHGSGDLGSEAHAFIDWLADAGQSYWQMLPVVPPAGGHSPYQSSSAFAGDPGLVALADLPGLPSTPAPRLPVDRVDFAATAAFRSEVRRRSFEQARGADGLEPFLAYCAREAAWLEDYALYAALKQEHGGAAWTAFPTPLRDREPRALSAARERLMPSIRAHQYDQYLFDTQWAALRAHARERGVSLIGDLPIFVGHDSADVWQHRQLFQLDADGEPTVVAGVPPDYFSEDGQRWGNALYDWAAHERDGFAWWRARFRSILARFDAVRVDHFIGFHRTWAIPRAAATARAGRYEPSPGAALFDAVISALGPLPVIAEDLGVVTPEVTALRQRYGFPGMQVLEFSFNPGVDARDTLPHACGVDTVVYTGTHDNDTVEGWLADLHRRAARDDAAREQLDYVRAYLDRARPTAWDLVRLAHASHARSAIVPLQDLLGQGAEARMNTPGTTDGNWSYRALPGQIDAALGARLRSLTSTFARTPA
ncbi:MAG: 4-alpha-glucanotransferase [Polyangiaceae bacterium]|nr:4-alpha-glucanotransferase [Polyangiaceae bacterium]